MSCPADVASGPCCPHPAIRAKIQPRVDTLAVLRADAEPLAGAGTESVDQHIGLGQQVQQHLTIRLQIEVDDPLAAMHQVDVLGRHPQTPGASHPHHVGTQIGEHHGGVRPRADAAEFDDPDPGEGSHVGHGCNLTQRPFMIVGNASTRLTATQIPPTCRGVPTYSSPVGHSEPGAAVPG